jgi:hypothetical protein
MALGSIQQQIYLFGKHGDLGAKAISSAHHPKYAYKLISPLSSREKTTGR